MNRYLLDTHTLLWFLNGSNELTENSRKIIIDGENIIFISMVSFWEMAIKLSLSKLTLPKKLEEIIDDTKSLNIEILKIEKFHLVKLLELDFHHRDPFDRMIISQALSENMITISKDAIFDNYEVKRIW